MSGYRESEELRALHPQQPWLWDAQWASGRIECAERSRLTGGWIATAVLGALSALYFLALPERLAKGNMNSQDS